MSKRDAFHSDDSPYRLPIYPPGLRKNYASGGAWNGQLDQHKFFNEFAANALDLYNLPPVASAADALLRLTQIGKLRSMLDAAEAVLLADGFEMATRDAISNGTQESLLEQLDEQSSHLSAHYYGVDPSATATVRSTFVSEAAVALRDTEQKANAKLFTAEGLRNLCTETLASLAAGEITTKTAAEIVKLAQDLDPNDVQQIEDVLLPIAETATDSAISQRARRMRERLHPRPAEERHREAKDLRNVSMWVEDNGMAVIKSYLPAEDAISIMNSLNWQITQDVDPEEIRSESQRRTDLFRDVFLDGWPASSGTPLRARVAVTLPALELLVDPTKALADLEGYGPIPMQTALRIAKDAPSMLKILTDPWSGAVIDIAREKYRPNKALRDLIRFRDVQCRFPGCNRSAEASEADHIDAWAAGGHTTRDNLHLLCKRHQMYKHVLGWEVVYRPDGSVQWRTPHGLVCVELPGSVNNVKNFDFAKNQSPMLPDAQMTQRVRRALGWEEPDAQSGQEAS